jgi:hypothetical protein
MFLLFLLVCAAGADEVWPFGGGAGPFAGRDDYNLGVLGAKVTDAARAPEPNTPPRGGRRSVQVERPAHDNGPDALRIELLFPGGPAEKAGLARGDVIVGVGSRKFSDGSMDQIAKALVKAEAGKGDVTLLVRRKGGDAVEKVTVAIPGGRREMSKPTTGAGRRALLDGALAWLAQHQAEDGGYPETLSGPEGAVVQTSVAGLAWLGAGSDLAKGPYKDNVRRAADFVCATVRSFDRERPAGFSQANWGWAHAAIFLGELHARTPDRGVLDALHHCAERLVAVQEESGGWAHGPGGKNPLGYIELNIVTGLALSGLGLAQKNEFAVPERTIARAEEYLALSSSGGGVGYSTEPGQRGAGNIGRTAVCWLAYQALDLSKRKFAKAMEAYVRRYAGDVLDGHASLMQHILLAGVAAHVQGGAAKKAYWEAMERDLVLARAPDGSFQPRPWHESLGMQSNSDVSVGEVWTTAAWAMVLASEPDRTGVVGYPAWSGSR